MAPNGEAPERTPPRTKIQRAALAYAARHVPVFPLNGKVPVIGKKDGGHGFKDATTDPGVIDAWFSKHRGITGIGTLTSGEQFVLDIDVKDSRDGEASLKALEAQHGALPRTRTTLTGGGGRQMWFHNAAQVGIGSPPSDAIGSGLDLKGEGGYVVLPPSIHPDTGRVYRWQGDAEDPIAEAPHWLVQLILENQREPRTGGDDDGQERGTAVRQQLKKYGIPTLKDKCGEEGEPVFEIRCQGTHPNHAKDDGRAYVVELADGSPFYACHDDNCSHSKKRGNHWPALVVAYEPWPDPVPLSGSLPPVPEFDLRMMPKALRPMCAKWRSKNRLECCL